MNRDLKDREADMSASPIEVVGKWLDNLLDPDVELNKIMPWAGTSHGAQAFLDRLGAMFSRWENQAFNVSTMFASDENVAVFGDFRYRSNSLGKVVSSPFSICVKVIEEKSGGIRIEYAGLARGDDPTLDAAVADIAARHTAQ